MMRISASILASVMFAALISSSAAAQSVAEVQLSQDQVVYEFVGQFNNNGAASQQFGYLSKINGLDGIFLVSRKMKPPPCSPLSPMPTPIESSWMVPSRS